MPDDLDLTAELDEAERIVMGDDDGPHEWKPDWTPAPAALLREHIAVTVREPASAVLVSPVSPQDAGNVRCSEHPDARILEERSPAGTGDTYLYCPRHSARGLVIGGRGYLARYLPARRSPGHHPGRDSTGPGTG